MQKTFIKYIFLIITGAIFLIVLINFFLTLRTLKSQQYDSFQTKIGQVIHTLENNQQELSILNKNLDEDYLTRAKAAAYVLDRQKEVCSDEKELQYLAKLLNVDEVHIIDDNGIIISSSVSKYVGIDMADDKQTRPFLSILESNNKDAYFIQDTQPNAAEKKIMKYVGVARKKKKGIVQVGFEPVRQLEAEAKNTYEYIFAKFPTDTGEELFAVDIKSGKVIGNSNGTDLAYTASLYPLETLTNCTDGAFKKDSNNKTVYLVSREYNDVLICAAIPGDVILQKLGTNIFHTLLYLLIIEIAVILLLNYLVRQKVVNGIHHILNDLSTIRDGNLDTTVSVGGNREFEQLSEGINSMVKSIVSISDRISSIIEISGIPLAAFECENEVENVFVTRGLGALLAIPADKAEELYKNSQLFDQYIRGITEHPVEGETDIFQVNEQKFIRIHMSKSPDSYLGVITDVTGSVLERRKLQYENTHDHLTGLYKFSHFKKMAAEKLKTLPHKKICAIVMVDLDYFKSVNDTYGHDKGDIYLKEFATVLQSMPIEHFLTARRSGDEFCMMIFDCTKKAEITSYLDNFYKTLGKHPVKLSETESRVISVSCGFAWTNNTKTNVSELLHHADEALYEMKRDTKGSYAEYKPE